MWDRRRRGGLSIRFHDKIAAPIVVGKELGINQSIFLRPKQTIEISEVITTLTASLLALTPEDFVMRFAIAATAAVLAVSIAAALTVSPAAAQKKKAAAQMSVNECIDLAKKRGYTDSDLTVGGGNPARTFVLRCLQGRQR